MDSATIVSDDLLDPPVRLFERLRQIAGYTWDDSKPPYILASMPGSSVEPASSPPFTPPSKTISASTPINLRDFLDFAIGAAQCLEILHHGLGMIHGEIRGDAFHYNIETNKVRLVSFGSGVRSFEHGLTSTGWLALSRELGAKNKLLYISPEQTGRMPAEPDIRTDIYSLGVLFWTLLTQQPVFEGETPLDIVQGVLRRRIPAVSITRKDVPDVISKIIQKCTAKSVGERYHSASGLRHDLTKIQEFLGECNWAALKELDIGTKDVSSFFMLPTTMIGRDTERTRLVKVIERLAMSHSTSQKTGGGANRFSDASSFSNEFLDGADGSSEGASSADGNQRMSGSYAATVCSDPRQSKSSFYPSHLAETQTIHSISSDTLPSPASGPMARAPKPWERHHSVSFETRSLMESAMTDRDLNRQSAVESSSSSSFSRKLGSVKFRQRGHTEIITIEGAAGQGSLSWSSLPEFLLGRDEDDKDEEDGDETEDGNGDGIPISASPAPAQDKETRLVSRSFFEDDPCLGCQLSELAGLLRAGAAAKSSRLLNTFLDVLRMFTANKFVCFCLDDLHYADDESLELISQIIAVRMRMMIILTYRPDEISPERMHRILHPLDLEQLPRLGGPIITRIVLEPLCEADIVEYVSNTLSRPKEEVLPLALVIQSKTAGNPFYMREMLNACHRKKCIWYDYRDSQWHFDLDKLFDQFRGEKDYDVLDTGFITHRLGELPAASLEILSKTHPKVTSAPLPTYTQQDAIAGLQAAIQAYILVPTDSDDRFRFAHDRYIQAAADLEECHSRRMHFVIAQTLLKHYNTDDSMRDSTALHICTAVDLIRHHIKIRQPFRNLLLECAQAATEKAEDVSYEETIQLYLRAAECTLFMGHHAAANGVLSTIFKSARSALDKAPAYVLQSRIFAQSGDAESTLNSLKDCLVALGVKVDQTPTYEKCDEWFEKLSVKIQTTSRDSLLVAKEPMDATLSSIGAVLVETLSAAWWIDPLQFYSLTLTMLNLHVESGAFPQSGMAFIHFAIVALSRFNMVKFSVELASIALELLDKYPDHFTVSRGHLTFAHFLAHISYPMSDTVSQMERLVDYAALGGDRISTILCVGICALVKFYASENLADLEVFCQFGCEEIPNWHQDSRGGTLLIFVRQTCKALQGKTRTDDPENVMTDEHHDMAVYKQWLHDHTRNGNRSLLLYETFEVLVLFLYGHYDKAIEVGERCLDSITKIWSSRNSRLTMLAYGLALSGRFLRMLPDPRLADTDELRAELDRTITTLKELKKKVSDWETVNNVNYLAWSKFLEAQVEELSGNAALAIQRYEEGLDHAAENGFLLEQALGSYLLGALFLRRKARRCARAVLRDATSLYRQFGALGVADHIQEENADFLNDSRVYPRLVDMGVQTDFATEVGHTPYRTHANNDEDDDLAQSSQLADTKGDRIGAWRGSMHMQHEAGAGLPALDMIDLHAILLSSQAMSSVLQVDELLKTMCEAILQTCGGSATLASIVVADESNGWLLAASGDPERGASAHMPGIPISGTSLVAENVVLYCTRFRESVFITDLLSDERFGNVSEPWLQRNPESKAVIAIPISHGEKPLLGVLYLEGEPGSFTDRNVTVLQLLVNQIGISYSNAMAMKAVEKVSAEYVSALSLQKDALAKALDAETKAKNAKAEAERNVKLAEEAARAKSIFLANVSHELRTPLNGVIGNSELLRESSLNRDQLEMADSIRVSADLLLTVINDILDFSRMEADKMKLYISAFNPEEMVREVVRAASYSNREKMTQVQIIQDINLPTMLIYGDPIRLHQVLGNLIGNSLKFTETGSVTIGARVELETEDRVRLTFWVEDTGIGIPPQQLANLFQPFSQADASTARKYGGSGLGLSICKSLIETMMKGRIQLESQETVGTRAWFTVTFEKASADAMLGDAVHSEPVSPGSPMEARSLAAESSESDHALTPHPFLDLSQIPKEELRVCIAEDNAINKKIAIQYVKLLGYPNVDAYENGQKAVEGLREKAAEGNLTTSS
ncbi:unnamed protein product [Parascedosporium putredinis]|uniref:histidine kinase n=1 Tax=Parascedosporium putredinis TaxID=1442378 RepID=A0A9P1H7D4_9PEZI|nr:unnamed protein product [Parascedosporium putredinis]CAI8001305.1 unnamed protein product [Parascedosporium putredinis]